MIVFITEDSGGQEYLVSEGRSPRGGEADTRSFRKATERRAFQIKGQPTQRYGGPVGHARSVEEQVGGYGYGAGLERRG